MKAQILITAIFTCLFAGTSHAADLARGKQIFDTTCAACHGPLGAGDGPAAVAMPADQKPRDFQHPTFKFAKDDAKMKELLHKGGAAVGLSPLMQPQPTLSDADVDNIIAYVRTLKK